MAVRIQKTVRGHLADQKWLQLRARRLIRVLSKCRVPAAAALKRAELSILLTGDRQIRKLNRDWRGKDKATDVLSFPQVSRAELRAIGRAAKKGRVPAWELGDVVISLERAKMQAAERGHSFREELELLCAHGVLHLLGFDHELGAKQARAMRRWETVLLEKTMIQQQGIGT